MPDANVSQRLQKTIVLYSAVGMLVVGITVGIVGVLPLARKLREAQRRNLMVDLQRQTLAVEQFVTRVRSAATRTAGRGREKLEAYAQERVPWQSVTQDLARVLQEPIDLSTNLLGVQIFDARSNLLVRLGRPIPREHWLWPEPTLREPIVGPPLRVGDETLFVGSVPILDTSQATIGVSMVVYNGTILQRAIEDNTGLGKTGETIVGSRQNKALPIFFPMRQAREGKAPEPQRISTVLEGLKRALEKRSEVFEPVPPLDRSLVLAHGPVKGIDWGLVVCMNRTELLSGINRQITLLGCVLVGLILVGTAGMVGVLRPLAGRVILHTDELESQIYEKTAALNTELAERKRAEQLMRDSEALYHSLVDTLPINILRKDLFGRVSYGNRGYCERMGKPLSELIGKTDYQLFPKELADKYCRDDEKVVRSGEMFEDIEEHQHASGDGRRLYVHVLKAPVHDALGKVVGTQVIFWDVTARKLAEQALEKAATELARSNKELEQFAYVASHDLQEPLRMITSYTQLIAQRYQCKLDQDAKEFMQFAVDGALRMQKLIQGLLLYSRVGTRGKPFEHVDCNEAVSGAIANLKIVIEENSATLQRDSLPTVMGDPVQLTQLFQNLISNGLKFRSKEPPTIQLKAERRSRPDAATLNITPYEWFFQVRDNGIGIEPQYFERIFVIFQRLHTQEQYPGTGIGLAICRKIIERHGGRIWIESKPGEGATFYFTLPALD